MISNARKGGQADSKGPGPTWAKKYMKFIINWFRIWDFIDGKTSYLKLK